MNATSVTTEAGRSSNGVVDPRGLLCPYPFIQAKLALESSPPGTTVEILTDSEATATSSIPILAERNGYTFTVTERGGVWRLLVTKP